MSYQISGLSIPQLSNLVRQSPYCEFCKYAVTHPLLNHIEWLVIVLYMFVR